jgi:hypothetical protein
MPSLLMPLRKSFAAAALVAGAAFTLAAAPGCSPSYSDQRPPLDELDKRDRGLQSKDVLAASDEMAADLLALPELNDSRDRWTVVVMPMKDKTSGRDFVGNYEVFIRRLRTNLAKQGRGRVQLVENRDELYKLQDKELDRERDDFGQGAGGNPAAGQRLQPDYSLYGTAYDMPNRGTNYYQVEFNLVNLKNGATEWTNTYEVRVARK